MNVDRIAIQIKLQQLTWQLACARGDLLGMTRASERLERLARVRLAASRARATVKGINP